MVFVGKCGIIAKILSRQNGVDKPGIFPVLLAIAHTTNKQAATMASLNIRAATMA